MAIKERFEGLDTKELVGGPLGEAAKASTKLAQSTAQFIKDVAFNEQNKVKKAQLGKALEGHAKNALKIPENPDK